MQKFSDFLLATRKNEIARWQVEFGKGENVVAGQLTT